MPPPTVFRQVPETWEEWQNAVQLSGNKRHPNQQDHWGSGSNIRKEEYLLLRVLWSVDLEMDDSALADLGLKSRFTRARQWLRNFPPFSVYLQQILSGHGDAKYDPNTNADAWGSGVFEVSAREQHRIGSALNSGRNMPKRQLECRIDEESVNTSLVMFLAALTTKYPLAEGQWTPHQRLFDAEFKRGVSFNAKVDGYYTRKDGSISILVEAKRSIRRVHEPAVSMQEATEVVAWLKCETAVHSR
jgi:hypothetical protein